MPSYQNSIGTVTIHDYNGEAQQVSFLGTDLIDGATFTSEEAVWLTLVSALEDLTLGVKGNQSFGKRGRVAPAPKAGEVFAQRELKWLMLFQTVTSLKRFTKSIPAPNLTGNLIPGTDRADLTSTQWAAFKAAAEAFMLEEETGEAVQLLEVLLIGRGDTSPSFSV